MTDPPSGLWHHLKGMFVPFRRLWLLYFAIAGIGFAVLEVQAAFPGTACVVGGFSMPWAQCFLGDSTRTPWGIVTGFFVHTSFVHHYLPNMLLLFAVIFVFCVTNALVPRAEKESRQRAFIAIMLMAGVAGNVVSLLLYGPVPTVGASGLDFAALGITLVFCLANTLPRVQGPRPAVRYYRDPMYLVSAVFNGLLAAGLLVLSAVFPARLLSVGPGVDYLAHFVAFVFAAGTTLGWVLSTTARDVTGRRPIES